jgi:hypothetical protein
VFLVVLLRLLVVHQVAIASLARLVVLLVLLVVPHPYLALLVLALFLVRQQVP